VRRALDLLFAGALVLALTFLCLPLLAIFLRVSPETLVRQLGSDVAIDALVVSFKTSLIAHVFILGVGTPAAYVLATRRFRGRRLVIALVELPLVLPPAVAGLALLAVLGQRGLLGETLDTFGIRVPLTQAAVVLAVVFVASPFYLRQAIAAFEAVDPNLLEAARTLGVHRLEAFRRVALPLAAGGLGAGSALAWARGLGEFGATIMFAGSLQGVTQTLPLAVYGQLADDFEVALAIGAFLVVVSGAVLVVVKFLPSWSSFASIFPSRSAPFGSS
jgi:molybdate transport system permease protein